MIDFMVPTKGEKLSLNEGANLNYVSIYMWAHKKVTTAYSSSSSKGGWNEKSRDNNVQMRCLLRSNANLMNAIHLIVAAQAALLTQLFQRRFRP